MPIVQRVVRRGVQVAGAVRDLGRLQKIAQILVAHGFGFIFDRVQLPGIQLIRRTKPGIEALPLPERATLAIQELGPTFVKLGQVLSTRRDLLPDAWCDEFQTLQDDVKQVSYEAIAEQIEASLGQPPDAIFERFEREPLAAASMAQVHRARLRSGEEVIAKILRPGVLRTIETDLDILRFLARRVQNQFPDLALLDLTGMVADFERSILEETDLEREASYTERFKRNLSDLPGVRVPKIFRGTSSREVLCQEFFDGVKLRHAREAGFDMEQLGRIYFRAAARMLFEDGFFHGDLHPGNVLVMRDVHGEPVLGLIDFGMAGSMTEETRDNVCAVLFASARMDFRTVAHVMFKVGVKTTRVNFAQFEAEVMDLMQTHISGRSMREIQVGAFLNDLLQGCLRHRIRVPVGYTMLFKAIMTSEGLAKDLIPEVDPLEEFEPILEQAIKARFSRDRLTRDATMLLMSADHLMRMAPIVGEQLLSDYERGELRVPLEHHVPPELEGRADRRYNRAIASVVVSALMVAAVMSLGKPQWSPSGLPVLSLVLFAGAFGVGFWLLASIMRTGGLSTKPPEPPL